MRHYTQLSLNDLSCDSAVGIRSILYTQVPQVLFKACLDLFNLRNANPVRIKYLPIIEENLLVKG